MATITGGSISGSGFGTGSANSDITVKDLDMTVSNYVKDQTPLTNMAMSKKRKINNVQHIWPHDYFRTPGVNAKLEGASVNGGLAADNTRSNLYNFTQIFTTVVGSTGTARAIEQAGGDPQAYQEVKQLTEIMFDVELQMVRTDVVGCKYSGQTSGQVASATDDGRRFGSLASFAGTVSSSSTITGTPTVWQNVTTSDSDDTPVTPGGANRGANNQVPFAPATPNSVALAGSSFWLQTPTGATAVTNDLFTPAIYKQLVTVAEARFNAKITDVVCATSRRTSLSDNIVQSRGINRVNSAAGDSVTTYEGDFNYTYQISDNWVMDQTGADPSVVYFLNPDVIQWGSLRELGPNNEVFSNADASLDQYIMEGTLIVRNPAGVAMLRNINAGTVTTPTATTRASAYVQRYIA